MPLGRTPDIKQAGFDKLAAGQFDRPQGDPKGEARSAE
jgi:hypothetical protein